MNRRRSHKESMNAIRKSYYESPEMKRCWLFNLINTSLYACKNRTVKSYSPRSGPCACISSRITTVIQVGKKKNKETIK